MSTLASFQAGHKLRVCLKSHTALAPLYSTWVGSRSAVQPVLHDALVALLGLRVGGELQVSLQLKKDIRLMTEESRQITRVTWTNKHVAVRLKKDIRLTEEWSVDQRPFLCRVSSRLFVFLFLWINLLGHLASYFFSLFFFVFSCSPLSQVLFFQRITTVIFTNNFHYT